MVIGIGIGISIGIGVSIGIGICIGIGIDIGINTVNGSCEVSQYRTMQCNKICKGQIWQHKHKKCYSNHVENVILDAILQMFPILLCLELVKKFVWYGGWVVVVCKPILAFSLAHCVQQ